MISDKDFVHLEEQFQEEYRKKRTTTRLSKSQIEVLDTYVQTVRENLFHNIKHFHLPTEEDLKLKEFKVYEPVDEGLLDEVTNLQEEEHKLREIVNAKRNQVLGKLKEQLGSAFEVKEEVGSQHQGDQRHEREGSSDQEGNAAKEKQVLSTEQVHELEAALKEVNKLVQSLSRDLPRSLDASNITVKSIQHRLQGSESNDKKLGTDLARTAAEGSHQNAQGTLAKRLASALSSPDAPQAAATATACKKPCLRV